MNQELFLQFLILNILNVVIQTGKSIITIRAGKGIAALVNAFAYGFYSIVMVAALCELPLMLKAGTVALCNLVGVFFVKWIEEKTQKDRLWKIEITLKNELAEEFHQLLDKENIPHLYIKNLGSHTNFNCYCETSTESAIVKKLVMKYNAHYCVCESQTL